MLQINESAQAYDLGEFLDQEQSGVFEVTTPGGEKFQAVARPGQQVINLRANQNRSGQSGTWQVRKIAEIQGPQSQQQYGQGQQSTRQSRQ